MKISAEIDANNKKLEALKRHQQLEESKLKTLFDAKFKDTKKVGEEQVYAAKLQGQDDYTQEILGQEERLKEIQDNYQKHSQKIDDEKNALSLNFSRQREDTIKNQQLRLDELSTTMGDKMLSMNDNLGTELSNLNRDKEYNIKKSNAEVQQALTQKYSSNERFLKSEDSRFKDMRLKMERDNTTQLFLEKSENEKELARIKQEGLMKKAQLKNIYEREFKYAKNQHDEVLKAEQRSFAQKFSVLKKEHEDFFKHITDKNGAEIQSLIENQSKAKAALNNRSDDPFYNTSLLHPEVEDKIDHYLIRIKVPEYEERNVILSGHNRQVKITHGRTAESKVALPDGSTNKSSRNETFLKEFNLPDLINSADISRKYQDGILSFKIAKL